MRIRISTPLRSICAGLGAGGGAGCCFGARRAPCPIGRGRLRFRELHRLARLHELQGLGRRQAPARLVTATTPATREPASRTLPAASRRRRSGGMGLLPATTRRSDLPGYPTPPYWNPPANAALATPPAPKRLSGGADTLLGYRFLSPEGSPEQGDPAAGAHDRCIETHPDRPVGLKLIAARLVHDAC